MRTIDETGSSGKTTLPWVLAVLALLIPVGAIHPVAMPATTVRVALCQMSASTDLNSNLAKMDSWAGQAAASGAQICVFPEWSDLSDAFPKGGYTGPAIPPIPGTTSDAIGNIARKYNLWIAVAIWEGVSGGVYDTLIFIDNTGKVVTKQRKSFVGGAFNAGDAWNGNYHDAETVPSPWGPLSGMVCADLGDTAKLALFPELQPALMICVFANGPAELVDQCPNLSAMCGCPVVGVNMWYTNGDGGKSIITDASGATLWRGGTGEVLKIQDIPLNPASNMRPLVDPGETQTVRLPVSSVTLRGDVTDDGRPSGVLTTTWSKVSGPGTVTFGNASATTSTAQFSTSGVYVLRLTANDGASSRSRDMFVNVLPASGDLNMVGHWTFENSGADVSGTGNNGALYGGATYSTDVPAGVGSTRSLLLSGGGDYFQVPHSSSLNASDSVTIACWVKSRVSYPGFILNGGNDFTALLSKGYSWGGENYALAFGRYHPIWSRGVGVPRNGSLSKAMLVPGVWTHLATVLDTNQRQGRIYVNGVLDHMWITGPGTPLTNADPLNIGLFKPGQTPIDGKIDDMRLYTRPLADSEIAALVPGAPVNQLPVVGAGSNLTITLPASASLQGSYSDDWNPGTSATAAWTAWRKVSGPGDVTFSSRYTLATTARFSLPGNYVLELRGSDGAHRTSSTVSVSVHSPSNTPPNAVCSASPVSGTAPLAVSFNGAGSSDPDGSIASYFWDFGDGSFGSGAAPSHLYASAGTYTATLTVTDNGGATDSKTVTITVTNPGSGSAFAAAFLGITGEDTVGPVNPTPNGNADFHVRVSGLKGVPSRVLITSDTGGIWESPYNGANWIVGVDGVDLWFEPWTSNTFHVKVTYADGSIDETDATNGGSGGSNGGSSSSSGGGACGATGMEAVLVLGLLFLVKTGTARA